MKRIIIMLLAVLTVLSLFSCAKGDDIPDGEENPSVSSDIQDKKQYNPPAYDEEGNYLGFSDIPAGYDALAAAEDGCLVIDNTNGTNEYGATVILKTDTYGYENWEGFEKLSAEGENAFIRVAHFIDGVGYYSDLHYYDGKYILFETNPELGTNKICEFKYLRYLEGTVGVPAKKHYYYVLTDSLELTYYDVSRTIFASSAAMASDIPFEWLGFTTYFDDALKQEG